MDFKTINFVVSEAAMSIGDLSEVWQKQEFSEDLTPLTLLSSSLFDKLIYQAYAGPSPEEVEVQLQDDPYHSYKVKRREDSVNSDMLLEDCPKEGRLSDCLISAIASHTQLLEEDSCQNPSQSLNPTEEEENGRPSKNSTVKNVIGYQTKKTIKLMFSHHSSYVSKKCKEAGISYREFKKYYQAAQRKLYGPVSIAKMLKIDPTKEKSQTMRSVFLGIFNKILRREYLIYSLRLGKMQEMGPYIREKNLKLLYFVERECVEQML